MAQLTGSYGFQSISGTITGPGGSVNFGEGAGVAEEGITFEPRMDRTIPYIGSDAFAAISTVSSLASDITIRLSRLSNQNDTLLEMCRRQQLSPALNAANTMNLRDRDRGTDIICAGVAFLREPPLTYAKEPGIVEWVFFAAVAQRIKM